MESTDIIIKPVISERSLKDASRGTYTFLAKKDATKNQVKIAVEQLFGVGVVDIFTNITKKTRKRLTRRGKSTTDITYKKARVTLKKDQKIKLFDEVTK